MADRETRFLSRERILGSIVGLYYGLALAVLCFNFGLLTPVEMADMPSRAEQFTFAVRQAGVLVILGTIGGLTGLVQMQFHRWFGRHNSRALTRLYLGMGLLASTTMFLMTVANDCSARGYALASALAWFVFYTLSMTVAVANLGVGIFLRART